MNIKTGYKQTEIGVIPEDWEVKKISECTDYVDYRGKTPKKTTMGRFLVTAKNIRAGYIDYEISKEYVSEDEYSSTMKRGVPLIGDILITTEAPLGNVALIDREDIALAQRVIKYRANVNLLNYGYLKHYFLSEKFQKILDDNSSGSTAKGIKGSVLHKLPIILPPLPEQTAIATALSDIDALMGELDKLIAKKRDIKQATMQQLLTGKKRLAGFSGEWEVKRLIELVNCFDNLRVPLNESQRDKMRGDYPYCGANGVLDFVNDYTIDDDIILIAEDGGYFDEYAYRPIAYRMRGKCWVNNHAHILKSKAEFEQEFIFYSLVHKNVLNFLASGTRAKLNKSEMWKIEINTPPTKEEQTAIATILSDMDAGINALQQKRDKTAQLKQGMMQELLTGRIRLPFQEI